MSGRVLKVVIIDDQPVIRQALTALLRGEPDLQIVGQASDGEEGLKVVFATQPDVITLDLEMPRLDGFAFLRLLMAKQPRPVVIVSSHATRESVFRALELGAVEFVAKPSRIASDADLQPIRDDLLRKLRTVTQLSIRSVAERMRLHGQGVRLRTRSSEDLLSGMRSLPEPALLPRFLVCIGASTGGPPAIATLLQALPSKLPISVLITQHMPSKFTAAFVDRLRRTTEWSVREADPDLPVAPGEVLVAPASHSLCVYRDGGVLRVRKASEIQEPRGGYVPSIDRMLSAAAEAMGPAVLAVILSGMSGDAVQGVQAVSRTAGRVLVESPQSAVIASMPEAVIQTGAVHEVAPLPKLASLIIRYVLSRPSISAAVDK
ncbi:MAG TPA: chemotaxis-specific protein-glutamate methyltransferase CheB [Pseudomonadota bacterium]|jgi:two-component system chemotaxis response regulator CheB|nr:chemotaxis-specific protein-glutamate methyltransferase CheB [Pseudomonadota bacterium]HNF95937.1 chemotaxis-specific protein-glutamate methyltransferase CheB [Pseudomonadota bacterium]HNI60442.1 chemotaxis-specific protein-glutamate methyltransferase CheB [Pseudomonadota bacterium]HNK44851.1 chemotaxis-specific protein-glutamate methyltransferase CheB [Pseudomonadota bacterium]HNN49801.1 chemotaxis-specific protein-glutamate methyltransferase CheB [Pseudomonadota bacterium]